MSLDFTKNSITELPDVVGSYIHLEEFIFSHNQLWEFPEWLDQLVSLRVIDVSYNEMGKIPDQFKTLLHLETLVVNNNKIRYLPLFLATLPKLKILSCTGNPIKNVPEQVLQASRDANPAALDFLKKKLSEMAEGDADLDDLNIADAAVVCLLRKERKENPNFQMQLPEKVLPFEEKFVCNALFPSCNSAPTAIQKINDGIWCGTADGSIYHWDCRTMQLREKREKVLPAPILAIIEIPAANEVWIGGRCNVISILPIRVSGPPS